MGRSPCCSKEGLNRGAWTAMEDKILTDYINLHGEGSWRNLPKRAGLKRCGKSCRLRWLNYLRPDIKRGNITPDEEEMIIRLHRLLGNRWSLIAGRLPGRTDNEIKNYWNCTLSRRFQADLQAKIKCSRKVKNKNESSKISTVDPNLENKESDRAVRTKAVKCTKVFFSPPDQPSPTPPFTQVEDPAGLMGLRGNPSDLPMIDLGGVIGELEFFLGSPEIGGEDSRETSNDGDMGSPSSLEEPIVFSDEMVDDWRKSACALDAPVVDYWFGA